MTTTVIKQADWAVTWDATRGSHVYRRGVDVAFSNGAITAIGKIDQPADQIIDGKGKMVMPGLVNIHCHPYNQPLFKGVREELGNPRLWGSALYDGTTPFQTTDVGRVASAEHTYGELLACGVTTVCDLSIPYEGWLETLVASGLRAHVAPQYRSAKWAVRNGADVVYEWDEEAGKRGFAAAQRMLEAAADHPSGRLSPLVTPAQVETCTPELLQESAAYARANGWPFQLHAGQSMVEFREIVRRHGLSPIQFMAKLGLLGPKMSIGHCIFLDSHSWTHWNGSTDMSLLADSGTSVAHCPTVFSRYGQTLESFGSYRRRGINVAIGTDTHPHNLLEEMRSAAIFSRIVEGDGRSASGSDVFHAATIGAATLLGREDIGRIAVGAKADLVLVDLGDVSMRPLRDPLRSLIYTAAERAISDVFVGGTRVVEGGKVLTIDREAVAARVEAAQAASLADAPRLDAAGRDADSISPLTLEVVP